MTSISRTDLRAAVDALLVTSAAGDAPQLGVYLFFDDHYPGGTQLIGAMPPDVARRQRDIHAAALTAALADKLGLPAEGPRHGGPEKCLRPCVECPDGKHHFADPMIDSAEEKPDHEAAKLGVIAWWQCKHCPAWREWTGDEDDDEELFNEVVDGFHRNRVGKEVPAIRERIHGYLPITRINVSRAERSDRIAATIRHNRARGEHGISRMSEIVRMLYLAGWTDEKIQTELGMQIDEVLRLKQITGLAVLFADRDFSEAWEPDLGRPADTKATGGR